MYAVVMSNHHGEAILRTTPRLQNTPSTYTYARDKENYLFWLLVQVFISHLFGAAFRGKSISRKIHFEEKSSKVQ